MPLPLKPLLWPCLALLLTACSPTFNWRELRDDAIPLQAMLPCKPERGEREVPLGGTLRTLHMHSCETGGLTFAVAWASLPDAAQAVAALQPWRQATLATLRIDAAQVAEPALAWPARVPGAAQVQGLQASGQGPAGQVVVVRAAYFSHGVIGYQAAIYGARIPDEVASSFFEALRLP